MSFAKSSLTVANLNEHVMTMCLTKFDKIQVKHSFTEF
jgi:hypothetical protein